MPETSFIDFTHSVRAIQGRTDVAGAAVDDLSAEDDSLINHVLTEGLVRPANGWNLAPQSGMTLTLGSGTAKTDVYVVEGTAAGQTPYMVRLDQTSLSVVVPAADASQQRVDEVYVVVEDGTYDAGVRSLPRIGYRKGDPGGGNPGPAGEWPAAALLWRITVPAAATEIMAGDLSDQRALARLRTLADVGSVARATRNTDFNNITSETTILTIPSVTLRAGRRYRFEGYARAVARGSGDIGAVGRLFVRFTVGGTAHAFGTMPLHSTVTSEAVVIQASGPEFVASSTEDVAVLLRADCIGGAMDLRLAIHGRLHVVDVGPA